MVHSGEEEAEVWPECGLPMYKNKFRELKNKRLLCFHYG